MMIRREEHPKNFVLKINCEVNGFVYFSFVGSDWPLQCKGAPPTQSKESCWRKLMGCKDCKNMQMQMQKWSRYKNQLHSIFNWHKHSRRSYMRRMRCSIGLQNSWCVAQVCKLLKICCAVTSVDWLFLLSYSLLRLLPLLVGRSLKNNTKICNNNTICGILI